MDDWRQRASALPAPPEPEARPGRDSAAPPDDALSSIRSVFFEEAEQLLARVESRLDELSRNPDDQSGFDEIAASGHTLRGSAALAELPGVSHVGALLERAAALASRQAEGNRDGARALVRETLAALAPARRIVARARAGETSLEETLLEELHDAFSASHRGIVEDRDAPSSAEAVWEADTSEAGTDDSGFDATLAESLADVFQSELKDLLAGVPDLIAGLADPAEQMNLCEDLGRIFHTVKGSAATVGVTGCRDLGRTLQDAFERVTEEADLIPLRPEFAEEIEAPLRDLFLTAGLEPPEAALELLRGIASASMLDADDDTSGEREPQDGEDAPAPDPTGAIPSLPAVEPEIMEAFTLDADAALEACESALLSLEQNPGDRGPLRVLFRQFHTLKGAAAAVGLDQIAGQLHSGETLLESAAEDGIPGDPDRFVRLLLEVLDSVTGLIDEARGIHHDHRILSDVDARIAEIVTAASRSEAPRIPASSGPPVPAPSVAPTAPSTAPLPEPDSAIVRVHASRLDLLMNRVSELVVSRTRMEDAIGSILEIRDKLKLDRMQLAETIESFRGFEFNTTATPASDSEAGGSTSPDDFTDLEFDKYDDFNVLTRSLVELAADTGEILEQLTKILDGLSEEGRQVSKVSSSLQRTVSAMRLQSLETLFRRLQRAVRDAARQAEREVEVVLLGGDVQLDRSLNESLYGPLLHVVRNAVSHGIEAPSERVRAGKPPAGRVTIEAVQRQGSVEILVRDDGRGLDFGAIETKARRLGMLAPDAAPDREQLARMIFQPGFSTKEQVTDLAGRGIGMDVVASEVEQLRGSVSVDSRDGAGTTFGLTLPLAAMIEQVLVLRAGDQSYAISQAPIETVLCIEPEQITQACDGLRVRVGGQELPAVPLTALTGQPAGHPSTALVVQDGDDRVALLVDRIEAQREAVVRPLGRLFSGHPFITSATFAGDGQVVFVIDASRFPALVRRVAGPLLRVESGIGLPAAAPESATVLWADDSISVRKLAGHFLSAEGWSAETAVDGFDALEKLRRGRFRILVTDLEMPRMHGYELLQEIRADPRLCDLPVVVCSSRSSEKHRRRAREAGATGYLTKPFTQEALAAVLLECLDKDRAARADDAPPAASADAP